MIKVLTIDELMRVGKHLLTINDRVPIRITGPRNIPMQTSVGMYRKILNWKEQGVTHVMMSYRTQALTGFNQPYTHYYQWSAVLLSPYTKMEPLKI